MQGIWTGMLIGTAAQTGVLLLITARTKWQKEVRFWKLELKIELTMPFGIPNELITQIALPNHICDE